MKWLALAVAFFAAVAFTPGAKTAPRALPPASFSVDGALYALAAAGYRVAVATATDGCGIRVATLGAARKAKPVAVRAGAAPCGDAQAVDLWLGRRILAVELISAETPHGEEYFLSKGPLPSGPLRAPVGEWGWRDDNPDEPSHGCAWSVAAGGGVIASLPEPNTLGDTLEPSCPGTGRVSIRLDGAPRARTTVAGSWTLLATDGRRLALGRLGEDGTPTGELSLVGLDGKARPAPKVDPATVKAALKSWLTAEGLVIETRTGLTGPGWTIRRAADATVAYGRVLYTQGRALRVRRIRDGADRLLLTLPRGRESLLAAGSFGLAVAVEIEGKDESYRTDVHRVGWRTIDAVLPAR